MQTPARTDGVRRAARRRRRPFPAYPSRRADPQCTNMSHENVISIISVLIPMLQPPTPPIAAVTGSATPVPPPSPPPSRPTRRCGPSTSGTPLAEGKRGERGKGVGHLRRTAPLRRRPCAPTYVTKTRIINTHTHTHTHSAREYVCVCSRRRETHERYAFCRYVCRYI